MATVNDLLGQFSKLSAGSFDNQLKELSDKLEELDKQGAELAKLRDMAKKFKKPSEYTPDFAKRLVKAGIDFDEGDGDHSKNVKQIDDRLNRLSDYNSMVQMQLQRLISDHQKAIDATSSKLKRIDTEWGNFSRG